MSKGNYGGERFPKAHCEVSSDALTGVERLLAIEQIKRTKAFYCFSMDVNDWDGFQNVFTTDVILEVPDHGVGDSAATVEGAAVVRQFVETSVKEAVTTHHCHTPIIDFVDAETANVVWAMEDMLKFTEAGPAKTLFGLGHYFETYKKQADGSWRIAHVRLERLRLEVEPW